MFSFHLTQQNDEYSSNYEISFPKGLTIKEFIQAIRKERFYVDEQGNFYYGTYNYKIGSYNERHWLIEDTFSDLPIGRVWARGDWGIMDFHFIPKEEVC